MGAPSAQTLAPVQTACHRPASIIKTGNTFWFRKNREGREAIVDRLIPKQHVRPALARPGGDIALGLCRTKLPEEEPPGPAAPQRRAGAHTETPEIPNVCRPTRPGMLTRESPFLDIACRTFLATGSSSSSWPQASRRAL